MSRSVYNGFRRDGAEIQKSTSLMEGSTSYLSLIVY